MCIVAGLSKVIHDPMYHLDKFKMTIIFSIVIYFENVFVVSLIGFVVITKCYNSYLGYLTKISHLLQIFFLYMLCWLLIGGKKFLLRDSLSHVLFFMLHIKLLMYECTGK